MGEARISNGFSLHAESAEKINKRAKVKETCNVEIKGRLPVHSSACVKKFDNAENSFLNSNDLGYFCKETGPSNQAEIEQKVDGNSTIKINCEGKSRSKRPLLKSTKVKNSQKIENIASDSSTVDQIYVKKEPTNEAKILKDTSTIRLENASLMPVKDSSVDKNSTIKLENASLIPVKDSSIDKMVQTFYNQSKDRLMILLYVYRGKICITLSNNLMDRSEAIGIEKQASNEKKFMQLWDTFMTKYQRKRTGIYNMRAALERFLSENICYFYCSHNIENTEREHLFFNLLRHLLIMLRSKILILDDVVQLTEVLNVSCSCIKVV